MTQSSASDRKDVRAAEKAAKLADRNDAEVITSIMSTLAGRWWVWRRLEECHIYQNPFTTESLTTAFGCGEMNVGQKLQAAILAACPEQYIQMQRESNERHNSHNRSTAGEHERGEDADGGDQERNAADDYDFDGTEGRGDNATH